MATLDAVARIAAKLPGITESRGGHGKPGPRQWRLDDRLLAWERPLRRSDLEALGADAPKGTVLAVRVDLDTKQSLVTSRSEVYFTTPHFDGYPTVLVKLGAIGAAELRALLHEAWAAAPKRSKKPKTARTAKTVAKRRT